MCFALGLYKVHTGLALEKNSVCKNCAWMIIEKQFFLHSVTQK